MLQTTMYYCWKTPESQMFCMLLVQFCCKIFWTTSCSEYFHCFSPLLHLYFQRSIICYYPWCLLDRSLIYSSYSLSLGSISWPTTWDVSRSKCLTRYSLFPPLLFRKWFSGPLMTTNHFICSFSFFLFFFPAVFRVNLEALGDN